jgi:tetratricopeptide (TPR) repeat protein
LSPLPFCVTAKHEAVQNLPKFKEIPYLCPVNPITLDKNFQAMQTIKIFLGSSITELHDERVTLGDYLMNSVRPIFKQDGIEVEVCKCEDIRSGNTGIPPQNKIDRLIRGCDVSVFMFKCKAGDMTVHEFDVTRKLQKRKRHEIYVYCFTVPEADKSQELKDFQDRLIKEPFYWYDCKDVTDLESQFVLGLLKFERQLLGKMKPSIIDEESTNERNADVRFNEYMLDEKKQAQRRKEIHKDIEDLLQQAKTVMANEDETIAARIFKVIELYKKADQWAAATAYDKEKYSDLLYDYAGFLYKYGLYKDAEAIYLRQIAIAEELYGKEHENTATSYNNIGLVFYAQGDYGKALEYYFKALAIWEKVPGTEHPDTATSYNNIGLVFYAQGDYGKALEYYFKALAIKEKVLGTEHPSTATSYNNIGAVYKVQGDYDKALEYYFKALAIKEKVLGTEHPDTATSYNNIAGVYYAQGDYDKTLEYYFKALAIREKVLGTEHPSTATSYNNIGLVYDEKGDYGKALKYYFKALTIREKVLGTEHPDTATSYNNIGWVYREQGEYAKALDFYTKAYQILKKKLGDDHPNTKDVLKSINFVKEAMKSFPEK